MKDMPDSRADRDDLEGAHYRIHEAFGVRFRSRLVNLPLAPSRDQSSPFDCDITVGAVPATLPGATTTRSFFIADGRVLAKARGVGSFLIEDGRRIVVDPSVPSDTTRLRIKLFGIVAGVLLVQRGRMALHGCAIQTPSGCAVFCGHSGAGKSTLAALLVNRGFRIVADDVSALLTKGSVHTVVPGTPHLKLTSEGQELVGWSPTHQALQDQDVTKYVHPLERGMRCEEPQVLRHIFVLDPSQATLSEPVAGASAVDALTRYIYQYETVAPLGRRADFFHATVQIANNIPVTRIGRPTHLSLPSWADLIAQWLRGSADVSGRRV